MADRLLLRFSVSTFLLLLAAPVSTAPQLIPAGDEFTVNTYWTDHQWSPQIAMEPSGSFVVIWFSENQDGSPASVFGQRFDQSATPQGPEFRANTFTTSAQVWPDVGIDGSGNFVVAWSSEEQDGNGYGVFGQRFGAAGPPAGSEFPVNTYTTGDQWSGAVAVTPAGEFVVVWDSQGQDGSGYGVFGQRFAASGAPQGAEFQVNSFTTGDQASPRVATGETGDFVVVWTSNGQDGDGWGVFGQRFDGSGVPLGDEFQVNTHTPSFQGFGGRLDVGMDRLGNFVVVWDSLYQNGPQTSDVFGQRFDRSGARLGGEFPVNDFTGHSGISKVDMGPWGNFVVVWLTQYYDSPHGIYGRRFDATGAPLGGDLQVQDPGGRQSWYPAVAMDHSAGFVVVWNSFFELGRDRNDVLGRQFSCSPFPGTASDLLVERSGTELLLSWTDAPDADSHVVFESDAPDGGFSAVTGTAPDGASGLTIPMPTGTKYYLVAGRTAECGVGPRK